MQIKKLMVLVLCLVCLLTSGCASKHRARPKVSIGVSQQSKRTTLDSMTAVDEPDPSVCTSAEQCFLLRSLVNMNTAVQSSATAVTNNTSGQTLTVPSVAEHTVKSYVRHNGTWVQEHWQSNPDGRKSNNYSTKGNINPHTSKGGSKN